MTVRFRSAARRPGSSNTSLASRFTSRAAEGKAGYDSHIQAGAKKVLLSAPAKDKPDATTWGGGNVFDVYTKADGTALDGTKYRDW